MIGSGWLYAALTSSGYAGAKTGWAWILGAIIVPLLTIGTLFMYYHGANLGVPPPPPGGAHGIFTSLTGAGIVFACPACRLPVAAI